MTEQLNCDEAIVQNGIESLTIDSEDEEIETTDVTTSSMHDRNRDLLRKMLELEHPVITTKMIEFLKQDDVCRLYMEFITQLPMQEQDIDGPLPVGSVSETVVRDLQNTTDALKFSYRATMLLSSDEPTDALLTFLGSKGQLITKQLFRIFQPNSPGNLLHGARILDRLLRFHTDKVYEVISESTSTVARYLGNMLQYIDEPHVADSFINLICKPHNAISVRYYASSPPIKWKLFKSLSDWKLLVVLGRHVCNVEFSEEHTVAAADVMLELLDRLAADDNGEILLQPAAYCPELLQNLIKSALDIEKKRSSTQRTAAIRCVLGILKTSAKDRVPGPPVSPYESFGTMSINLVTNQLASLRDPIYKITEGHIDDMLEHLKQQYIHQQNIPMSKEMAKGLDHDTELPEGSVRHTSYVVKVPFTEFRMDLIETIVQLVGRNYSLLEKFSVDVWRTLVRWFFEYAHNNLYHASFCQLVFYALRQNNEETLTILMKKLKLVTVLIDHYQNDARHSSNRGYILLCCNLIRLQVDTLSPDSFLRGFLRSHATWRSFEPELKEVTASSLVKGLGFYVPRAMRFVDNTTSWGNDTTDSEGIDHGSEYAKALGFIDDIPWPVDSTSNTPKKKKGKKKKKKSTAFESTGENSTTETSSISTNSTTRKDATPNSLNKKSKSS